MEWPTDLLAQAQVCSNYKHHSPVKFLIGITPQGTISFLSPGVGEECPIKKSLNSQGWLSTFCLVIVNDTMCLCIYLSFPYRAHCPCDDYARMAMAEVKIPPFTKRKKQFEKVDIDWSRELFIVQIHVERIIGVLKQNTPFCRGYYQSH